MQEFVTRPKPSEKKIKTSEDFELCYLRHQYIRRVKFNPTEKDMDPYIYIVENLTGSTFVTYYNLFINIGMYREDVTNIGRIHLVSFLGLYSLDQNIKKRVEFDEIFERNNFKKPNEEDYLQKNRANFSMFLKQRMEDLVRVCRQKVKNVQGKLPDEYFVFFGKNKPPKKIRDLLEHHKELEYHKLDFSIFKSIRKKADISVDCNVFKLNEIWYAAIPVEQKRLTIEDFVNSEINPYANEHCKIAEDLMLEKEYQNFCYDYENKEDSRKMLILKKFVAKNKKNRQYIKEVTLARKILKRLGD